MAKLDELAKPMVSVSGMFGVNQLFENSTQVPSRIPPTMPPLLNRLGTRTVVVSVTATEPSVPLAIWLVVSTEVQSTKAPRTGLAASRTTARRKMQTVFMGSG